MTRDELMSIGAFARGSGLTPSALRFYQDSGLLAPAEVDDASGYRFYAPEQVSRAVVIRRLRELGLSLGEIAEVLAAEPGAAGRLVDLHVTGLVETAARARETAAVVKAQLAGDPVSRAVAGLRGPVLAAAIEQILTATGCEPEFPALHGVRFEVDGNAITLTATDRYRLVTRTLVSDLDATWAGTLDGEDLRASMPSVRSVDRVRVEVDGHGVRFAGRPCRVLDGEFPDHRLILDGLAEPGTRVTVGRRDLVAALEAQTDEEFPVRATASEVVVGGIPVPARVTGPGLEIWFRLTVLYPAISVAVGPDVMLDLRAPDQPVTVRSADDGALTTVAMPVRPPQFS